jgi:hypothetical protein
LIYWGLVDLGLGIRAGGPWTQAMHSGFADGGFQSTIKNPPINNQSIIKDPQITNGLKIFG